MHKKLIGLVVAMIAVVTFGFFSTQSAAAEAPTAAIEICVNVQMAGRQTSYDEEITWELRASAGGSAVFSTPDGENVANAPSNGSSVACFDALGVPGTDYQLWVKGDDTLSGVESNMTYPAVGPYMSSILLIEGDSNGANDGINFSDFGVFGLNWNTSNDLTDYNEDGSTNFSDFGQFGLNWATGAGPAAVIARDASPLAYSVRIGDLARSSAGMITVPVEFTTGGGAEPLATAQIDLATGGLPVTVAWQAPYGQLQGCTAPQASSDLCVVGFNFGSTGGVIVPAILTIDASSCPTPGSASFGLQPTSSTIGENGTGGDGNSAAIAADSMADLTTVGCVDPSAVELSGTSTTTAPIALVIFASLAILGTASLAVVKRD